jgi:hypothetical protein
MGELDLMKICGGYAGDPVAGARGAWMTVLATWLPLLVYGLVLSNTRWIEATAAMVGAEWVRRLARLAITIHAAPIVISAIFLYGEAGSLIAFGTRSNRELLITLATFLIVAVITIACLAAMKIWHDILIRLQLAPSRSLLDMA